MAVQTKLNEYKNSSVFRYTDFEGDMTYEDKVYYDLGLGKRTNFKYPWWPKTSPDFCANAVTDFGIGKLECNEFYFTRA